MDGDQVRVKKTESQTKWHDCGVALETFPRLIFGVQIFFFFQVVSCLLPSPLVSCLQSTSPCPCPPSHSDRPSFSVPLAVPLAFDVPRLRHPSRSRSKSLQPSFWDPQPPLMDMVILLQLFYRLHNPSSSKWIRFGIPVGILVIAGASLDSASTCFLTQHPSCSPSHGPSHSPSCRPFRSLSGPPSPTVLAWDAT